MRDFEAHCKTRSGGCCDFNRHWDVAYRIVVRHIIWGESDKEDVVSECAGEHVAHVGCCGARWLLQRFKVLPDSRRRGFSRCLGSAIPCAPPCPLALDKTLVVQLLQHGSAQLAPIAEHRLLPSLEYSELYGI